MPYGTPLSCSGHNTHAPTTRHEWDSKTSTKTRDHNNRTIGRPCCQPVSVYPAPLDMATPHLDDLSLSDSDPDALFDSPDTKHRKQKDKEKPPAATEHANRVPESRYGTEEARENSLRTELDSIRNINKVVEDVVASLEKAKANMGTVNSTISHSQTLLQTWTRILSATEHNQRLILNPNWHGATQDLADIESEEVQKQAAAERRHAEEQARREEVARRAEEEERRKAVVAQTRGRRGSSSYGRVTRGRVANGSSRTGTGTSSTSSGYSAQTSTRGPTRGIATGRTTGSGIGRGVRGRARGAG